MGYLLVRHKVQDFAKWKPAFDGHKPMIEKAMLKTLYVLREESNPNNVFILFEAADLAKAKEFTSSKDLQETMTKAGVMERPDMYFLK